MRHWIAADLYCQEAVRSGHVAARVARSKLAERGKREERERKATLMGSGDCQSGDRQARMQTATTDKWMPEEAVWTENRNGDDNK